MKHIKDWPACSRIVHLAGGILAINEAHTNLIRLWPNTTSNEVSQIRIHSFGSLYGVLMRLGYEIIGAEFITHQMEATGQSPTQFRGFVNQESVWPNWDATILWGGLTLSAFHNKNGLAYDLSNRIKFQLHTINDRLKNLSLAYQKQLNARYLGQNFKEEQRFQDGYTDLVYQEFHSFLFDAGIMRDYLCEYVFNFSRDGTLRDEIRKCSNKPKLEVTTASGLFKGLKKVEDLTKLEAMLIEIMGKEGWLHELGQYRDLVMHSAPINIANSQLYAIQEIKKLPDDKKIMSIRFPIPSNPSELYSERSKRDNFDKYIGKFKELSRLSLESRGKYDCMEYAHKIFGLLTNLALEVAEEAPYKPMQQGYLRTKKGYIPYVYEMED